MSLSIGKKSVSLDETLALISKLNEQGHENLTDEELYMLVFGFLVIVLNRETETRNFKEKVIETLASSLGCGVDFVPTGSSNKKSKIYPKYRNPDNHLEEWTGRGNQPTWVRAHLKHGGNLDDLRIIN